ncbi:DUF2877 domain-containing protein [Actinomadura rubrisoli]|uniref:DUF2877 domain-containing protein n=1 Tax=Actinomadura rubrisoli TaxID=2530368 RepID=A0A4R5BIM3_9ACTN|nr:DUF2877 domain-containing protein [Actinomadura rubrisoli]TDD84800.1 DUF2877 domain-containing protein [Actinomadura rubrisoli]
MNPVPHLSLPSARRVMPGAASRRLQAVLTGPLRPARVLGVFPSVVYLAHEAGTAGTVVAVCATDAVRLPNSVVLAVPRAATPFAAVTMAGPAWLGAGRLRVGPLMVAVSRWWTPRRPRPATGAAALRDGLGALEAAAVPTGLPPSALADLEAVTQGAARGDLDRTVRAAARLMGLGPGLTPSGDDVLAGFLVAHRQLPPPTHPRADFATALGARVEALAAGRTTALSAALLGHAARGDGCPQLTGLVDAVGGHASVPSRLGELLPVGHTSGADLALGVAAAGRAVLDGRRWAPPRRLRHAAARAVRLPAAPPECPQREENP